MTAVGDQQGIEASRANDRDFAAPDDVAAELEARNAQYRTTPDEASKADVDAGPTQNGAEGQTSRDISPEEGGIPDLQDDTPTMQRAEDPQFEPLPGETPTAALDWGTTAFEQSEGESLTGRLEREVPDSVPDIRPAEDPGRAAVQLHQDLDSVTDRGADQVIGDDDSGTGRTGDDMLAAGESRVGGEGPEEGAVHIIEA